MAFCAYCGKQIAEGQVCGCPESMAASSQAGNAWQGQQNVNQQSAMDRNYYQGDSNQQMPYQGNPNQQMPYQGNPNQQMPYQGNPNQRMPYQGMPNQPYGQTTEQARQAADAASRAASMAASSAGNILTETFGHFLLILKAPAIAGRNFVVSANAKISFALILLQAISSGLFSMVLVSRINTYISTGNGKWITLKSEIPDLFSGGKTFAIGLFMSIAFSVIFALLSWLIAALAKGKTGIWQMLAVAGVRGALLIPINLVSLVALLIMPTAGVILFVAGGTLMTLVAQVEAMKGVAGVNDNAKMWFAVISTMIFFGVMTFLVPKVLPYTISQFYMQYADKMKEALEEMRKGLGELNLGEELIRELISEFRYGY